ELRALATGAREHGTLTATSGCLVVMPTTPLERSATPTTCGSGTVPPGRGLAARRPKARRERIPEPHRYRVAESARTRGSIPAAPSGCSVVSVTIRQARLEK